MSHPFAIAVLLAGLLAGAAPARAQTQRSGGGGEAQRIMLQYQQGVGGEGPRWQAQSRR